MIASKKEEFLKLARRSRVKWILDTLDVKSLAQATNNVNRNIDKKNIPGVECIQQTLDYLTDIIDDGTNISVDTLMIGLNDYDIDDNDNDEYDITLSNDQDINWSPYLRFISKLRHPSCKEIVKSMQQFVSKFEGKYKLGLEQKSVFNNDDVDAALDTKNIWSFLEYIQSQMKQLPIFMNETNDEWEKTKESCEKFIYIKLYNFIFDNDYEDKVLNERLKLRIESLSFLSPEHLDIKSIPNNDFTCLTDAIEELKVLNEKKSPIEKIECVKKCSFAIGNVLKNFKDGKVLTGADEFLPLLILIIAKCNPINLHSNLKYLQKYTHPSKLVSEVGYLLTHFICAAHFLENVDADALTISPSEFEKSINDCKLAGEAKFNDMKAKPIIPQKPNINNEKQCTITVDASKKIPNISIREYVKEREKFVAKMFT